MAALQPSPTLSESYSASSREHPPGVQPRLDDSSRMLTPRPSCQSINVVACQAGFLDDDLVQSIIATIPRGNNRVDGAIVTTRVSRNQLYRMEQASADDKHAIDGVLRRDR
jgi:hypothetical protein